MTARLEATSVPDAETASSTSTPSEYEGKAATALSALRQISSLLASINDRSSAEAAVPRIIDAERQLKQSAKDLETFEAGALSAHERLRSGDYKREAAVQMQRINSEYARLQALPPASGVQEVLERLKGGTPRPHARRRGPGPGPRRSRGHRL